MKEEIIFQGHNIEEVAQKFAELIVRNYLEYLEFWKKNAKGEELNFWIKKIKSEPKIIKKNAYKKILKIMKFQKENEEFYKDKWLLFKDKDIILINKETSFYKDLLPGEDLTYTAKVNRKYMINKKKFLIAKKL